MSTVLQRLADAGVALPAAPKPIAAYVPSVLVGDLVFVSGQIPMLDGSLTTVGPVPSVVGVEAAASAGTPPRALVAVGLASRRDGDTTPVLEDSPAQYRDFLIKKKK